MASAIHRIIVAALLVGAAACSNLDGPKKGVVVFALAQSCPAFNEQTSWSFFADGSLLGSPTMTSGQQASYLLEPGTHTVRWKWNNALHPLDVTSSAFPIASSQSVQVNIDCVTVAGVK